MDNNRQKQMLGTSEQMGADQPSDEHRASGFQGPQQRHQQSTQDGEVRPQGIPQVSPVITDVVGNRCQADGCMEDLSGLRRYFRRYHVCETHIRSQVVLIGGRQVRFCDQCSTFHPLAFFDGQRRTCRDKLEQNRLKRRIRKAQNVGQQGPAAAAALAAITAGVVPGGGGAQQSDDADSDDQPVNGGMLIDGDDAPALRAQGGRNVARKRQSGISAPAARRQQPAPRQSAGPDVTKALKAQHLTPGHQTRAESQSPESADEEGGRRTPGSGCGPRDDTAWAAMEVTTETGVARISVSNPRVRHGEAGFASDWPRVNNHDLRDQEHLQAAHGTVRNSGMYSPRSQTEHLGPQGSHALRSQPFKGQHVPLPSYSQQQQQSLATGNWDIAAGGVIALERLPQPATQGTWRQHGGSMPNLPQEPSESPTLWPPAGKNRSTWHSVPAIALPTSGTPSDSHTVTERALRDGSVRLTTGPPVSTAGYEVQPRVPQATNGAGFQLSNSVNGSESGFGGTVGHPGRMAGRLRSHMDPGVGAPAVTLLAQVMRTELELRRQPPRTSQPGPEPISPATLAMPGAGGNGGTDLLPGTDGLTPAQQAALRLQLEAGLLSSSRNMVGASQPQPQAGANVQKQWMAVPLDAQQQQLHQQEPTSYGLSGPPIWTGNGMAPQGALWAPSQRQHFASAHVVGTVTGAPGTGLFSVGPHSMVGSRRMSAGSSVYTADEEAHAMGLNEQEVSSLAMEAVAVAAGAHGGTQQQPIEEAPSLLNTQSFKEDIDRDNAKAQIWETQHRQQQHMQMLTDQQHLQKQQQVQIVVSIPNHQQQLQAFQGEQRVTLLDHIQQEESQRNFKLPHQHTQQQQQQQQQTSLLQQHMREQGLKRNANFGGMDTWQTTQQQTVQSRSQTQPGNQNAPANFFGHLYEQQRLAVPNAYPLSAFHMQGPVDDLDGDTDYANLQSQQGNAASVRTVSHGANGKAMTVAQLPPLGGGGALVTAPCPPSPEPRPQHTWPCPSGVWGSTNSNAGAPRPAFEAPPPQQPEDSSAVQQLGNSLAGVAPSDQELILSTLMKFAAHPPRAATTGQERGLIGPPPAHDVQGRGFDPASGTIGGNIYALQQDRHTASQPQPSHSAAAELIPRQDAARYNPKPNNVPDGTQQVALGDNALQPLDSVAIMEALSEGRGSLQLLDSVDFAQMHDLRPNTIPAMEAAECGAAGVQGGPPTPPPHGGDGFAGYHGGIGRAPVEEDRWLASSSDRQIGGPSWRQMGRNVEHYMNGGEWISLPAGEGLRAWERQQQPQQQQDRSSPYSALMASDRCMQQQQNPQQQQPPSYRTQSWSQQQPEDLGEGCRPHAIYRQPCNTDGVPFTGPGRGAGEQTMSHVALKFSHAHPDSLPPDLVQRMQDMLRGGGAAVLPPTLREGCVEVLVEVLHNCSISELCKKLFHLPEFDSATCASLDHAASAAISASEQLRAWVGAEVFDACERVTMQLLGGPVLDCTAGALPKLMLWETAMQQAGLGFAADWPNVLRLHSGPPVLVADAVKAQEIHAHGPAELESRPEVVRLNVRIAGGACPLGAAEAVALISEGRAAFSAEDQAAEAICLEAWQQPSAARNPSHCAAHAAPLLPTASDGVVEAQLLRDLSKPELRSDSTFAFASAVVSAELRNNIQGSSLPQRKGSPAGTAGVTEPPCFAIVASKEGGTEASENSGWDSRARCLNSIATGPAGAPPKIVADAGELLRSCFLMAPLPSSQPSSPVIVLQRPPTQQHRLHGCTSGLLTRGQVGGITSQREQEQQQDSPRQTEQKEQLIRLRSRSKSDDGTTPSRNSNQIRRAFSAPPRVLAPPPKSKSLSVQLSVRRRAMPACTTGNIALISPAVVPGATRGCADVLSGRVSLCSTATLTTAMTLHEKYSCRSSSTALTNATTLYDRMSLRSDWSCISTLTSFGGVTGNAGGAGGGSCSVGGAALFTVASRTCEPLVLSTIFGIPGDFEQTLRSGTSIGIDSISGNSPVAPGAGLSMAGGSPNDNGSETCGKPMPSQPAGLLAEAADDTVVAHHAESRRNLLQTCEHPSFKVLLPESASDDDGSACELTVPTPRLARASVFPSPMVAAAAAAVAAADQVAAAPAQLCDGSSDQRGHEQSASTGHRPADLKSGLQLLRVRLPVLPRAGLVLLEATGGHAVASCWPLLVVETAAQQKELVALWRQLIDKGQEDAWSGLVADLGLVLGILPRRAPACELDLPQGAGLVPREAGSTDAQQSAVPVLADLKPEAASVDARPFPVSDAELSTAASGGPSAYGEGDADNRHDTAIVWQLRRTSAVAANWTHGNQDRPYCDSLRSVESAYQESWGTFATHQSAVSEQRIYPSPSHGATLASTSSGGSGSGGKDTRCGNSSDSNSSDSDCSTLFASDPELCDIAALVVGCSGVVDDADRLSNAPACAASTSPAVNPDGTSAFGHRVTTDSGAHNEETYEFGAEGNPLPSVGCVCVQQRDEPSLASDLGSVCDAEAEAEAEAKAEDDPSVVAVTKYLAGLRTVDDACEDTVLARRDSNDGGLDRETGIDGCDDKGVPTTAAASTGALVGKMAFADGNEVHGKPGFQTAGTAGTLKSPVLPPAAAVGLSKEARAALQAAVSRLQRRMDRRRTPALWELLARVEANDEMKLGTGSGIILAAAAAPAYPTKHTSSSL
ncbi:hypothetical protein VaNZ11_012456 [Volvox africanus]|uniref:SBP-type domain-containing protein n=1 Tax=Volvox africanus TaxID=51714 RepID=A0ABQ5SDW1_9CHLO|nr:hypothetical protein VaNZ11_012456 [Volvox africanus]